MTPSDRIDELKKRYDENPRRFFASLANEYRKAGDLEQAITLCQTHLAEQPANMNGHVVYGQALFESGRFDEAKVTFETALSLDSENLIALRLLGDIACANGANDEARQWYGRVLDTDPRNQEIIALLAQLAKEAQKAEQAAAAAPVAPVEAGDDQGATVAGPPAAEATHAAPAVAPVVDHSTLPVSDVPVVTIPPLSERMGLLDLPEEFESSPESLVWDEPIAPADMDEAGELLPLEDTSLGNPLDAAALKPYVFGEFMLEPFVESAPGEIQSWESEAADSVPAATAGEPAVDQPEAPEMPAEPAHPFVTETMAELYLLQGFNEEALEVYRLLLAANPDDAKLKKRVRKLARGDRDSMPLDVIPGPGSVAGENEVHEAEEIPAKSEEIPAMSEEIPAMSEEIPAMSEEIPAMSEEIPATGEIAATTSEPAPIPQPEVVSAPRRSARTYFAALAARLARRVNGSARPTPTSSFPGLETPAAGVPVAGEPATSALDALFRGAAVAPDDEHVALALSRAAVAVEGGPPDPDAGAAASPAESSLDSMFRETPGHPVVSVPRQSQNLRFDQFFAAKDAAASPPQPPAPSAPSGDPGSPAELKQFQSWLLGLKKP